MILGQRQSAAFVRRIVGAAAAWIVSAALVGAQPPSLARAVIYDRTIGDSSPVSVGRVQGMVVSSDGRIFVLDAADFDVKSFDLSGAPLRVFGRRGGGPGELGRPVGIRATDTSVIVSDQANGLVEFSFDGKHLATSRGAGETEFAVRGGGHVLIRRADVLETMDAVRAGAAATARPPTTLVLLRPASGKTDTLVAIENDLVWFQAENGSRTARPSGFGQRGAWAVLGDSVVATIDGSSGVVRILRIGQDGDHQVRTASMAGAGTRITASEVSTQEARMGAASANGYSTGGGTPPPPVRKGRILNPPATWSVATRALFADDGALWVSASRDVIVRENRSSSRWIANNTWTVWPIVGPPYRVELPSTLYLTAVCRGRLVGIPTDGEGGVRVYRFRDP